MAVGGKHYTMQTVDRCDREYGANTTEIMCKATSNFEYFSFCRKWKIFFEISMHTIGSIRLLSKDDTQERLLFCYKNVSSNANQKFLSAKNLVRILLIDLLYQIGDSFYASFLSLQLRYHHESMMME